MTKKAKKAGNVEKTKKAGNVEKTKKAGKTKKTIPELRYEIRPSKIFPGEVGVFAVRNFKIGDLIDDVDSPEEVIYVSEDEIRNLDPVTKRRIKRFSVKDEEGEYCIPADLNNMGSSWYFNHSCDSNVAYDKKCNFVAIKNIKKDEELFLDYGRMYTDPELRMKCSCGAKNCRGAVTGNDWLDPEFRKNNKDLMWPEMGRAGRKEIERKREAAKNIGRRKNIIK